MTDKLTPEMMIVARLDRIEAKVDLCVREVAGLKVKAGVWGALAGLVPVVLGLGMWAISVQ